MNYEINLIATFIKRLNNSIGITTIVVVQAPNRLVSMIRREDFCDLHNRTIQAATIIPGSVLPRSETNSTSIGTITVDCVTRELVLHNHVQMEMNTNPPIITIEN